MMPSTPWHQRLVLLAPARIQAALDRIAARQVVPQVPNLWQLELGVLRMWHRILFRPETIGTCTRFSPRRSWRARLLSFRPLRGPFLLIEAAIAPWDNSGLLSGTRRIRKHLMCAHHDGVQFAYDFELLLQTPGELEAVRDEARSVVDGSHPRAAWLRDLCVYERYHEELLEAVERFLAGDSFMSPEARADPDISFRAFLTWCAAQPDTPASWRALRRAGQYRFPAGQPVPQLSLDSRRSSTA